MPTEASLIHELREAALAARVAEREARAAWDAAKNAVSSADAALLDAEIDDLEAEGWTRPGDLPLVEMDLGTHAAQAWLMFTEDGHKYAWGTYVTPSYEPIPREEPYVFSSLRAAAEHARRRLEEIIGGQK